ncbi:hypothetical protein JHW43_003867 [Diplocarpon mali]|nr:hypothetical protein JHW43_003867 [Diplocarpon mali]
MWSDLTTRAAADAVPPAVAAALAAAQKEFNTEAFTSYAVAVTFTALRTYARIQSVGGRNLQADDYIVWLAILLYTGLTVIAYLTMNYSNALANDSMPPEVRAALDPSSRQYHLRVVGSKLHLAGTTTYMALIFTLKCAMLVFYLRLMDRISRFWRVRIFIGFGIVGVTFAASIITLYTACHPLHKYWQIKPDPGSRCQVALTRPMVWVTFISSLITDIYLMLVPLPMLWSTNLRMAKKLAASFVLGAGVFVLICAILKVIYVETDPVDGARLGAQWTMRESFVSVIVTSLPMVFPLLKAWLAPWLGSIAGSTKANSNNPTGFRTIGGGGGGGSSAKSNPRRKHRPDSLSYSDSEDAMMRMQNLEPPREPPEKGILVSSGVHVFEESRGQRDNHKSSSDVHPKATQGTCDDLKIPGRTFATGAPFKKLHGRAFGTDPGKE